MTWVSTQDYDYDYLKILTGCQGVDKTLKHILTFRDKSQHVFHWMLTSLLMYIIINVIIG